MAFKILSVFAFFLAAVNAGYLNSYSPLSYGSLGYAHSYATPLAYSAGHYGAAHTHLSAYSSPIISKTIATAPLAYSAPLAHYSSGLSHHYHAPSVYAAPIVTKAVVAAPIVAKTVVAAPVVHKTIVSTPVITKTYAPAVHAYATPSLYTSHAHVTPSLYAGHHYGLGYSGYGYSGYGYPSLGYAAKYHF